MAVSSILVGGDGIAGGAAAIALAQRGLEVTLVQSALGRQGAVDGVPVGREWMPEAIAAAPDPDALASRLRALAVEVRPGVELVGCVIVDRHVEAELSDGRIENYDAVVVVPHVEGAGTARIIASGGTRHPVVSLALSAG